jgi:3-dehydroquinate dehydratase / shikimate dehydrogenase
VAPDANARATIVATMAKAPSPEGAELALLPSEVGWLEVRADLTGDLDPDWLRARFSGMLLYSLRSGTGAGGARVRLPRSKQLIRAALTYDLVELEGERDLVPEILAAVPPNRRIISWHGPACDAATLTARFQTFSQTPARLYRFVSTPQQPGDELHSLSFLRGLGRSDAIAYAEGRQAFWTRLLAPRLGSPIVFGGTECAEREHGEPSVHRLIEHYGLPRLDPVESVFGIVGTHVYHSLSPQLHNAAYRALGIPAIFLTFPVESFAQFWTRVVDTGELDAIGFSLEGLTVASPYKEEALGRASDVSVMVRRAGSTNLLRRTARGWMADTTDSEGILPLLRERRISLADQAAAVVGCGGSGRAVAASLETAGANVTLVNRGLERGRHAVQLLGMTFVPLSEFSVEGYSVVVNATPVGTALNDMPFAIDRLSEHAVVVDQVYGDRPTPLMAGTRALGRVAIDGREVLLTQVRRQFELMIGRGMPLANARRLLGLETPVMAGGPQDVTD